MYSQSRGHLSAFGLRMYSMSVAGTCCTYSAVWRARLAVGVGMGGCGAVAGGGGGDRQSVEPLRLALEYG
jgi:hypothetical protein